MKKTPFEGGYQEFTGRWFFRDQIIGNIEFWKIIGLVQLRIFRSIF